MNKKKYISTIFSFLLAITVFTPTAKGINYEPISKIAKAAGYSALGVGSAITGAGAFLVLVIARGLYEPDIKSLPMVTLYLSLLGLGGACSFYTSSCMFKNAYDVIR